MSVKPTYLNSIIRTVLLVVCISTFQLSQAGGNGPAGTPSNTTSTSSSSNSGSWFSILSSTFEGEYLVIRYTVRYPGMVKVKMFTAQEQLLWRSQYVNNKEGEHKITLRAKYLDPGSMYIFEFDYKNHKERFNVSL